MSLQFCAAVAERLLQFLFLFQTIRHAVECIGQRTDFVGAIRSDSVLEVSLAHAHDGTHEQR